MENIVATTHELNYIQHRDKPNRPKMVLDLKNKQYDMDVLQEHIYAIHLIDILKTQKIDELFAVYFILNKNYQLLEEEENITIQDVLLYQPHLNPRILFFLYNMDITDNIKHSFPNFEDFC